MERYEAAKRANSARARLVLARDGGSRAKLVSELRSYTRNIPLAPAKK
jgi:hypothetical protein